MVSPPAGQQSDVANTLPPGAAASSPVPRAWWCCQVGRLSRISNKDFPAGAVDKNLPASAGALVRRLVWEDPACRGAARPVRHNDGAPPLEPALLDKRAALVAATESLRMAAETQNNQEIECFLKRISNKVMCMKCSKFFKKALERPQNVSPNLQNGLEVSKCCGLFLLIFWKS